MKNVRCFPGVVLTVLTVTLVGRHCRCFAMPDPVANLVHQIRDRKSSPEEVSAAAEELREKHLLEEPGAYRLVLNTLTKRSAWTDALSTWDEMRWIGTELEEPDFVLAMKAFTRGSRWQASLAVFAELLGREPMHLSAGRHREDLQPDCRAYTAAIDACRRVGAWTQAVQVLEDMEEMTVTPDVVAYNAVMAACEKGREYPAAERVMLEFDRWALDPDRVTYNTLIGACGWGQEWKSAVDYLRLMQRKSYYDYDLVSYTAAISACAKASEWETALALMNEEERQVKGVNIRTFNAALSACAAAGKCEFAMLLMEQLLDFDLSWCDGSPTKLWTPLGGAFARSWRWCCCLFHAKCYIPQYFGASWRWCWGWLRRGKLGGGEDPAEALREADGDVACGAQSCPDAMARILGISSWTGFTTQSR